jgi:hypothetical protein
VRRDRHFVAFGSQQRSKAHEYALICRQKLFAQSSPLVHELLSISRAVQATRGLDEPDSAEDGFALSYGVHF